MSIIHNPCGPTYINTLQFSPETDIGITVQYNRWHNEAICWLVFSCIVWTVYFISRRSWTQAAINNTI